MKKYNDRRPHAFIDLEGLRNAAINKE